MVNQTVPGELPSQRLKRWGEAAKNFRDVLGRTKQALLTDELGGIVGLNQARAEALGLQTDRYACDICRSFGAADSATRIAWLQNAAKQRDGRTLAALLEGPAFVHQVPREMMDRFMDFAEETHAPEIAERRTEFNESLEAMRLAVKTAELLAERAVDENELRRAAELERAQAAPVEELRSAAAMAD